MADIVDIYEDVGLWVWFEGEEGSGEQIGVYRRCTDCGKYITKGELWINGLGGLKLKKWICKDHGEVLPYFERI